MAKAPEELLGALQADSVETETLLQKTDESGRRIRQAAADMRDGYSAAVDKVEKALIAGGVGSNPELEERHRKLLQSRLVCDRVHSGSRSRADDDES